MLFKESPADFNPKFEVVSCFLENDGEILLLHRQDHKSEGNTWGVPAGKVADGEEITASILREIKEETGLTLPSSYLSYFEKLFVKYPDYDFVYHIFHAKLDQRTPISLNPEEHKDHKWTSPKNALNMPLIKDEDECIKMFYFHY